MSPEEAKLRIFINDGSVALSGGRKGHHSADTMTSKMDSVEGYSCGPFKT